MSFLRENLLIVQYSLRETVSKVSFCGVIKSLETDNFYSWLKSIVL